MPPRGRHFPTNLFFFSLVFALLVSDAAAGLASGLARGLAFAASAVLRAFAKVTGFDSFDMFHFGCLRYCLISINYTLFKVSSQHLTLNFEA